MLTSCTGLRVRLPIAGWLLLCGCHSQHYEIALTPQRERIERVATVSRTSSQNNSRPVAVPDDELNRFAGLYSQTLPTVGHKHAFRGEFGERLPDDVGGHGAYARYASPCGSVTVYLERFRGGHDIVGELDASRAAVGQLVELLVGWTDGELGPDPHYPAVREFLTTTFRRDLENLSTLIYVAGTNETPVAANDEATLARITLFLHERGYVTAAEVPAFIRANEDLSTRGDPRAIGRWLHGVAVRHLKLDNEAVIVLKDYARLEASLSRFLRETPEYRELKTKAEQDGDQADVDPWQVLSEPLLRALFPRNFLLASDHVAVRLASDIKPFATNGEWRDAERDVQWDLRIEPREPGLGHQFPRLSYALWATPDVEFQTRHFGKVVLNEQELLHYCLWYRGLTPAEAEEWNRFVETLQPDEALFQRVKTFQFRNEPPDVLKTEPPKSAALPGVKLLREGLTRHTPVPAEP
jgi:hypothetical protein